jgi:hypothetical protein
MLTETMDAIGPDSETEPESPPDGASRNRVRFSLVASIAVVISAIPYLWVLLVEWNDGPSLYRTVFKSGYAGNFYDLQARAILAGHLYVPKAPLAVEAWIHDGHAFTYFGIFPSLLRIPILLTTHHLDGRLTALSLLVAWLVTALVTSVLVWRVRVMVRGSALLGRSEALILGVLVASVLCGSVLVYLASLPYAYSEDMAWSVALSLGGFLALLGVLERPSWQRVTVCGLLIVAANLTRVTGGYATVLGAVLVAIWFALGRRGMDHRRWWLPMLAVAVVGLASGGAVNWLKFGTLFSIPLNDYAAFHHLHESRINGGRYFDIVYFPSALVAYLGPGGLRFTHLFPFITLPTGPARALGGVKFDFLERTSSLTTSMPLLFLLSCIGVVSAFRRRAGDVLTMIRLLLVAAAAGAGIVLLYGSITNRYLADFLPFLVLASAVGVVAVWGRVERRSRRFRMATVAIVVALGAFGVAANVGLSIAPNGFWTHTQEHHFLHFQKTVRDLTSTG